MMGIGPLQGYQILHEEWEAGTFKPAHIILKHMYNPNVLWVVVRGTGSVCMYLCMYVCMYVFAVGDRQGMGSVCMTSVCHSILYVFTYVCI
jgi:hypothetical protein